MASHLINAKKRVNDWKFTWTTATSSYIIDRGAANLPGTGEAEEYSYATDEEVLRESINTAGYTNISLETVLDDRYNDFLDQSLHVTSGLLTIEPKAGTQVSGTWKWLCNLSQVTEPSFKQNEIPIYNIVFSVLGKGE